jgi:hypothetical protein
MSSTQTTLATPVAPSSCPVAEDNAAARRAASSRKVLAGQMVIGSDTVAPPADLREREQVSAAWRGVYWPGLRDGRCARHGEVVGAVTAVCLRCHLEQLAAAERGSREWERPAPDEAAPPISAATEQRALRGFGGLRGFSGGVRE